MTLIDADTGEVVNRTPALRTSGPMTAVDVASQCRSDVLRPWMEGTGLTARQAAKKVAASA